MSTASQIADLLSRSLTDWVVSENEERTIVHLLAIDPDINRVIGELSGKGLLDALVDRVDGDSTRPLLLQILGGRLDAAYVRLLRPSVNRFCSREEVMIFESCDGLQTGMTRLGLVLSGAAFDPSPFAGLVGSTGQAPFGGSGATGKSPKDGSVPRLDQLSMLLGNKKTIDLYSNPIPGSLPGY